MKRMTQWQSTKWKLEFPNQETKCGEIGSKKKLAKMRKAKFNLNSKQNSADNRINVLTVNLPFSIFCLLVKFICS